MEKAIAGSGNMKNGNRRSDWVAIDEHFLGEKVSSRFSASVLMLSTDDK